MSLASLLIAVAIAERGKAQALDEIRRMGATVVTVSAEVSRNRGSRAKTGTIVTTLTLQDAREIERVVPGVSGVAGEYRAVIPVKVGDLTRQAAVSGIEASYAILRESGMRDGSFFTEQDDVDGARVAVLGARMARDLYDAREPVGEQIRIRGIPFTVIGVLPERGTGLDAFDEDEVIFIPLRTARRRVFQVDFLQRLWVRADPSADLTEVTASIVALLGSRHRTGGLNPPDFRVQDQRRLVTVRTTAIARLDAFQDTVSAALLLAGAGGVFALQLFAVRERRGEIGTRRAVGATRRMIFAQFVLESGAITLTGGVAGVALGVVAGSALSAVVSRPLALRAFAACCAAGLLAAAEPARRAAALPPAVALRAQ